jgi:hypothetical protein
MEEIIESYINGQFTQMTNQIKEYGVYDFSMDLQQSEILEESQKLELICIYLRKVWR